jgi:arabinose-5-phosphate isomerase
MSAEAIKPIHKKSDIELARQTLQIEIEGLIALQQWLDETFLLAVDTIQLMKDKNKGRLILSGIGKSGHVARKIAATMASTGTPSYFIHPAEASHGDLGMISEQDVILLFSNSGENAELTDMIMYAKRFSIPLIAITSNPEGALAKHATIALVMPKMPEACPNGLAPTTSTTMMLALGDALSVSLLHRMNLTPEQFKIFHPGGKLGQKLKLVSDVMIKGNDLPIVKLGTMMSEALITLSEKNMGAVIVVNDDLILQGIITDGDLKRHMNPDLLSCTVEAIMTKHPKTITPEKLAIEAVDIMVKQGATPITSLIVADEIGQAVGLLRIQDLLKLGIV